MDDRQIKLVQDSWAHVTPLGVKFTREFYNLLFEEHPEVEQLFPDSMVLQEKLLFKMINSAVSCLPSEEVFVRMMSRLGDRHRDFGLSSVHYSFFLHCLMASMKDALADEWTGELESAWREVFKGMSLGMLTAGS
ncbi:hypothetical protein KDL29_05190 [bacterium]|nr:hypothetical protein [bacterium]